MTRTHSRVFDSRILLSLACMLLVCLAACRGPAETKPDQPVSQPSARAPAAGATVGTWVARHVPPHSRSGTAVVYDSTRKHVVLFGGLYAPGAQLADTWILDTDGWRKVSPTSSTSPTSRAGHAMVYDFAKERILLFGGFGDGSYNADTWAFDGRRWTKIAEATAEGPAGRSHHGLAYDPENERVLLFGGHNSEGYLDDLWTFDGNTWRKTQAAGDRIPPPRASHAMTFDPERGSLVVFGGNSADRSPLKDTWIWDGNRWTEIAADAGSGPSARSGAVMAYDSVRRDVFLFGGHTVPGAPANIDLWRWDGQTWSRAGALEHAATASDGHALAFAQDTGRLLLLLLDREGQHPRRSLWAWDGERWEAREHPAVAPGTRAGHAMAQERGKERAIVFGGGQLRYGGVATTGTDLWRWDEGGWTEISTEEATRPSPRFGHAMTYDAEREVTVLFGGRGDGELLRDTWTWDGERWSEVPDTFDSAPSARVGHALAYDTRRGLVILFGGCDEDQCFSDTWTWDGTRWAQKTDAGGPQPRARTGHAMAFDPTSEAVVLHGGMADEDMAILDDLWSWDGESWTRRAPTATVTPGPRTGHALVTDPTRHRVLLFGGTSNLLHSGGDHGDVWELQDGRWIRLADHDRLGPARRSDHAAALVRGRDAMVLHGGVTGTTARGEITWEWQISDAQSSSEHSPDDVPAESPAEPRPHGTRD